MSEYHIPPDDYSSPSTDPGCFTCGEPVIYAAVVGGCKWVHLANPGPDHGVEMGRWWDTVTGEWVEGNPLIRVEGDE